MSGARSPELDPFPNLAWLRENAPVSAARGDSPESRVFLVTPYRLVRSCLADPRLGDEPAGFVRPAVERTAMQPRSAAVHLARQALRQTLSPGAMRRLRPRITEICKEITGTFAGAGAADLMSQYAKVISVVAIHELIGVPAPALRVPPAEFMDQFWRAGHAPTEDAIEFVEDHLRWLLAYKRAHPGDDIATSLLAALDAGQVVDEEEVRGVLAVVLGPGHTTTALLLAAGIVRLLERPGLLADVTKRQLWPDAVDELLRFDSVVQLTNKQYALEDLSIGGVPVPKGSAVLLSLGGANRDPERFADPDEFDVDRPNRGHVAFGHGPHFCPGARLGRLEVEIGLEILFTTFPDIRLACPVQDIVWSWGPMERGPALIPAIFTPAVRGQ
jgi:cytochrome P450